MEITIRKNVRKFIIDNKFEDLSYFPFTIFDHYTSVYEVIRYQKKLFYFEDHYKRLQKSLQFFDTKNKDFKIPDYSLVEQLLLNEGLSEGNIRIEIFPLAGICISYLIPYFYPPRELYFSGVDTTIQFDERPNQGIKIFNKNLKEKTLEIIERKKVFETILVNHEGEITEGSKSNIFFIKDGKVYTSLDEQVLQGITKQNIEKFLFENNIELIKTGIQYCEVNGYESAFLTGTSIGALPISKIDGHQFKLENSLLKKIILGFNQFD